MIYIGGFIWPSATPVRRHVYFGPGDRCAGCPEGFEQGDLAGIHGAEAQPLKIIRVGNRPLVISKGQEAPLLYHRQHIDTGTLFERSLDLIPVVALIEEGTRVVKVIEQERNRTDENFIN